MPPLFSSRPRIVASPSQYGEKNSSPELVIKEKIIPRSFYFCSDIYDVNHACFNTPISCVLFSLLKLGERIEQKFGRSK